MARKPKSKKHGIGLSKERVTVDPSRTTLNTVSVFVDDSASFTHVDGKVESHKWNWLPRQNVSVIPLTDPTGGSTMTAAIVQIQAYCVGKKTGGGYGDGDDDLTVTIYYDDPGGGTETDECTFTDIIYDTSSLTTKAKNDRPRRTRKK